FEFSRFRESVLQEVKKTKISIRESKFFIINSLLQM
ncbi:MAG: hypothetical protein ACI90Q_002313, partial [Nonlabens sp.]